MVIRIVNIYCFNLALNEPERDPVIASYLNGPHTFLLALQRVKLEARQIHVVHLVGSMQQGQNGSDLTDLLCG